jgi:adenylylsulfate kinase
MGGTVLWITGLPGSGKSAIADAVKNIHPDYIILRMDELRKIVTPAPSYSDTERDLVYRSLVFLAAKTAELGHNVIIDATGNMRKWRDLARYLIPQYIEVYLKCPKEVCIKREAERKDTRGAPRDIYRKGETGWPVPGINAPYEEPLAPAIIIDTGNTGIEEAVKSINELLCRQK